jgi:hypothetical protein
VALGGNSTRGRSARMNLKFSCDSVFVLPIPLDSSGWRVRDASETQLSAHPPYRFSRTCRVHWQRATVGAEVLERGRKLRRVAAAQALLSDVTGPLAGSRAGEEVARRLGDSARSGSLTIWSSPRAALPRAPARLGSLGSFGERGPLRARGGNAGTARVGSLGSFGNELGHTAALADHSLPMSFSVLPSRFPSKYLSRRRSNTDPSGEMLAKSVAQDFNFMSSGDPKIS